MSDNPDQASEAPEDGRGVLGSLPSTRPDRLSRRSSAGSPPPRRTARKQPPPEAAESRAPGRGPSASALVTTAVQAAGELAQVGVTLGGQLLRGAVRRLPRL